MTGKDVHAIRLYCDLTQKEFAETIGVSHKLISKIETNTTSVTFKTKVKIVREYGAIVDEAINFIDTL